MSDIRVELQAQIERKHQGCLNTTDYTVTSNGSPFALRDRIGEGGCLSECLCTDFEGEIKLSQANSSCNAEIMAFELLLHDLGIQGGRRCDFVIAPESGNEYIVFCELTLSKVDYVAPFIAKREEDKQEKKKLRGSKYNTAYNQCCDSIQWCLAQGISFANYKHKKAFFGWRESTPKSPNKATKNMQSFAHPRGKPNAVHKIVAGFQFQMVRYPEVAYLYHS